MAKLKLVKREPLALGNFRYTFECLCVPMAPKTITIDCANDNEAWELARMECDEYCGGG